MSSPHQQFDAAVVIGRFQPFHNGHRALIAHALSLAPRVLIVLGSAYSARSPKNPWTHTERAAVIADTFPDARLFFLPVRDYYDERRWRSEGLRLVQLQLPSIKTPRVAVVGHFKDSSSRYLEGFSTWSLVARELEGSLHATDLRNGLFGAGSNSVSSYLASLKNDVPSPTLESLQSFVQSDMYAHLAAEWRALRDYKASWACAPFTPIFVTVDAVVTCNDHVVLVQRGRAPGRGLWALPGGFIEPHETTLQASWRELAEETGLALPPAAQQPVNRRVFDHPARSQRGRTISHAFHFSLDDPSLPKLRAADDAADARWIAISDLQSLEEQMFDDHFHILDTFLGLLPPRLTPTAPCRVSLQDRAG